MTLAEALQRASELGIEVRIAKPASRAAALDMEHCFTEHWSDHGQSVEAATIRVIERVIKRSNP